MDQNQTLLELNQKIDVLTNQVQVLAQYVQDQQRRQREWDELKADLVPVANDMYLVAVEQLSEIEAYVQLEDLVYLMKRLARNSQNVERLLDQVESLSDLLQDASPIVNEAVLSTVEELDAMEQRGYFNLAKEGKYVLDQVVDAFGPEDARQLGDNIVTILTTVKEMTQPEVMGMVQNLAGGLRHVEAMPQDASTSLWGLLKQFRDPKVRRGLAMTMGMLRIMGEETNGAGNGVSFNDTQQ
jgi:uncharacterized protein YjgD (DUF1641 family)